MKLKLDKNQNKVYNKQKWQSTALTSENDIGKNKYKNSATTD